MCICRLEFYKYYDFLVILIWSLEFNYLLIICFLDNLCVFFVKFCDFDIYVYVYYLKVCRVYGYFNCCFLYIVNYYYLLFYIEK